MKRQVHKITTILEATGVSKIFILAAGLVKTGQVFHAESPRVEGFRVSILAGMAREMMSIFTRFTTALHVIFVTSNASTVDAGQSSGLVDMTVCHADQKEMRARKMMRQTNRRWTHYAIVAILGVSLAYAQGTPRLDLRMDEQKLNLSAAEMADEAQITYIPGDTLLYTIIASNVGDGLMTEPEIVDPIPAGVTYLANTAKGDNANITFSIDQGRSYMPWPPTYTVRNAQGELIERKAGPEMVTHIKWSLRSSMDPGDASTLAFMVEVSK